MELEQLTRLLALLREHGVTSYRNGDLELRLGAVPLSGEEVSNDDGVGEDPADVLMDVIPDRYKRAFGVANG